MNIYPEDWPNGLNCRPGMIMFRGMTDELHLTNIIHELRAEISRLNASFEKTMKEVARITENATAAPMIEGQLITIQLEDRVEWLKAQIASIPGLLKKCRDARAGEASAVNDCVKKSIRIEDLKADVGDLKEELAQNSKDGYDFAQKYNELSDKYLKLKAEYLKSEAILRASRGDVDHFRNEEISATRRGNALYSENEKNKKRVVDLEEQLKAFGPPFIGGYSPRALAWKAIEATYNWKRASALPWTIRYKVAARVFDIPEDKAIHVCEALHLDAFAPGYVHIEHPLDNIGGAK